jgi:hypothetical protein
MSALPKAIPKPAVAETTYYPESIPKNERVSKTIESIRKLSLSLLPNAKRMSSSFSSFDGKISSKSIAEEVTEEVHETVIPILVLISSPRTTI